MELSSRPPPDNHQRPKVFFAIWSYSAGDLGLSSLASALPASGLNLDLNLDLNPEAYD